VKTGASIVVIIGQSGYGKSWYAASVAERKPRAIIIDPKLVAVAGRPQRYTEPYARIPGVRYFDGDLTDERDRLAETFAWPVFTAIFGNRTPAVQVIRIAKQFGDLHLHFDEFATYRRDPEVVAAMVQAVQTGRSYGLSFSIASQRPQGIPRDITELATEFVIFRSPGPLVQEYIANFGVSIDFEQVGTLQVGQHVRVRV
jgi:hypothetical protein